MLADVLLKGHVKIFQYGSTLTNIVKKEYLNMQDHKINLLTPGSIRRNTESFSCQ